MATIFPGETAGKQCMRLGVRTENVTVSELFRWFFRAHVPDMKKIRGEALWPQTHSLKCIGTCFQRNAVDILRRRDNSSAERVEYVDVLYRR